MMSSEGSEALGKFLETPELVEMLLPFLNAETMAKNPLTEAMRPFVRVVLTKLDGIGEVVRGSPLLLIVIVLDGCIAINDFAVPPPSRQELSDLARLVAIADVGATEGEGAPLSDQLAGEPEREPAEAAAT